VKNNATTRKGLSQAFIIFNFGAPSPPLALLRISPLLFKFGDNFIA
jgi:hypothetical protein